MTNGIFQWLMLVGALNRQAPYQKILSDLKSNLSDEGFELYDKIVQLTLQADDGKMRLTDCREHANLCSG